MSRELYRQYVKHANLAIERYTERVPNDGKYHVLLKGEIVGTYKTLTAAQGKYNEILKTIPRPSKEKELPDKARNIKKAIIENKLLADEIFWETRHERSFYRRGGKLKNQ